MIFEPEIVKGFKDYLPEEALKRREVKRIIEDVFVKYGFMPLETPVLEFDELMRGDNLEGEDEAVSDRFRLKDKGGRNLGLRYEFTFQLARLFKQNPNLKLPFKRYQIGEVFRDEPTGHGRYRQFVQCDADVVGDSSIESDAECLAMVVDVCKSLGIEPVIEVNNRKLISAIIESVRIENPKAVMKELDKLGKLDEDTIKSNLKKYADANQVLTLFRMMEKDLDFFEKNLFEGADELKALDELGKYYGFEIKFNPSMMRGLSYYTGNIFEVKVEGQKNTVIAGGRYDKTVGKFSGKEIPAVGISFGLDRITEAADIEAKAVDAILISLSQDEEVIQLGTRLRKKGISCVTFFGKPGKGLDYANSYGIKKAVFVGAEEVKANKYKLKDLDSGEEELVSEKSLVKGLS